MKIGERYVHEEYGAGRVIDFDEDMVPCLEFDNAGPDFHGNHGSRPGKDGHCYFVQSDELTPEPPKLDSDLIDRAALAILQGRETANLNYSDEGIWRLAEAFVRARAEVVGKE